MPGESTVENSESELLRRRSSAFEHLSDGVMITTLQGTIVDWNSGATRMFGWSREEMLGRTPAVLHRPCDAARLTDSINDAAAREGQWTGEITFIRKDGSTGICETTTVPMRDGEGQILATLGVNHDVTAQKAAEGLLIEEKRLLQTVIDAVHDVIFFKDTEGRYVLVNRAHQLFWHLPKTKTVGRDMFGIKGLRDHADQYHADDLIVMQTGEPIMNREEPFVRADGTTGWFLTCKFPLRDLTGAIAGVVGISRDITDRRKVERALADEREMLRTILDALPDPVFVKDAEGRHILHNAANLRLFRFAPDNSSGTVFDLPIPREHAESYAADDRIVLGTGEPVINREEPFLHETGETGYLLTSKFPLHDSAGEIVGLVGIGRDITEIRKTAAERQALERKLQETQKLESLGLLAGGIAHDFNNLLTGVLGNVSLAARAVHPGSPAQESLNQIEAAASRASELCRQMLAYSGKGHFMVEPINLSAMIRETADLLSISIEKGVALEMHLAENLPPVTADATQLQQIIMNLVINASEAIGGKGGSIVLTTRTMHVDSAHLAEAHLAPDLPAGHYVRLEVADNGSGMAREIAARIFDPFFTTKFTGRGLGLAAVLGIVRGHRGAIWVETEEGRGTTFKIMLPCSGESAQSMQLPPRPLAAGWSGQGKVLVIDDEEILRDITAQLLSVMGFEVALACDGREGVDAFAANPAGYVLVLLDLTMPGMKGTEVFREIRRLRPGMQVLLMSGFDEEEVISSVSRDDPPGFVQKPFTLGKLREKIQQTLAGANAG